MDKEIEVSEYIRTKRGEIARVSNKNQDCILLNKMINKHNEGKGTIRDWAIFNEDMQVISKHSKNIIDLIEVGDILDIKTGLYSGFKYFIETEEHLDMLKKQINEFWVIETILTHEQYDNNKFEV